MPSLHCTGSLAVDVVQLAQQIYSGGLAEETHATHVGMSDFQLIDGCLHPILRIAGGHTHALLDQATRGPSRRIRLYPSSAGSEVATRCLQLPDGQRRCAIFLVHEKVTQGSSKSAEYRAHRRIAPKSLELVLVSQPVA